jgi:hypothetical protein
LAEAAALSAEQQVQAQQQQQQVQSEVHQERPGNRGNGKQCMRYCLAIKKTSQL